MSFLNLSNIFLIKVTLLTDKLKQRDFVGNPNHIAKLLEFFLKIEKD